MRLLNMPKREAAMRPLATHPTYKYCPPSRCDVHHSWSPTTVMPTRVYFVSGIAFLFCAFILSMLVAISLPSLPAFDIVRCRFTTIHDGLPYLLSDTTVSTPLLPTLTTLLIHFSLSAVWCLVRSILRFLLSIELTWILQGGLHI